MWLWYVLGYLAFYTSIGVVTFRRTGALAIEAYNKASVRPPGKKHTLDDPCEYAMSCVYCKCVYCHGSQWHHARRRENPKLWRNEEGCDNYEAKSSHPTKTEEVKVNWSEATFLATFWPFWWTARAFKLLRARGAFDDFFKLPREILTAEERYAKLQKDIAATEEELNIPISERWNS